MKVAHFELHYLFPISAFLMNANNDWLLEDEWKGGILSYNKAFFNK